MPNAIKQTRYKKNNLTSLICEDTFDYFIYNVFIYTDFDASCKYKDMETQEA